MTDGFHVLARWAKATMLTAGLLTVGAAAVGLYYLSTDYTNRGWGLLAFALGTAIFTVLTRLTMRSAVHAEKGTGKAPLETKPTLETKPDLSVAADDTPGESTPGGAPTDA